MPSISSSWWAAWPAARCSGSKATYSLHLVHPHHWVASWHTKAQVDGMPCRLHYISVWREAQTSQWHGPYGPNTSSSVRQGSAKGMASLHSDCLGLEAGVIIWWPEALVLLSWPRPPSPPCHAAHLITYPVNLPLPSQPGCL